MKDQYTQPSSPGGALETPVTRPEQVITRTPSDVKISKLEEQISVQHQEILKLRRDINRLKNTCSDLELMIRNRG